MKPMADVDGVGGGGAVDAPLAAAVIAADVDGNNGDGGDDDADEVDDCDEATVSSELVFGI